MSAPEEVVIKLSRTDAMRLTALAGLGVAVLKDTVSRNLVSITLPELIPIVLTMLAGYSKISEGLSVAPSEFNQGVIEGFKTVDGIITNLTIEEAVSQGVPREVLDTQR